MNTRRYDRTGILAVDPQAFTMLFADSPSRINSSTACAVTSDREDGSSEGIFLRDGRRMVKQRLQ